MILGLHKKSTRLTDAEKEAIEYNLRQEKFDDKLRDAEQKSKFKQKLGSIKFPTYTKNLVAAIVIICLLDLQLTYILAFMGRDSIAEELSKQLCITILGVAFTYMIRAYFDSKAEHNNLKDKLNDTVNKALSESEIDLDSIEDETDE